MIIKPENPSELAELLKSRPLILYGMGDTGRRIAQWCGDYDIPYLWSDKNADLQKNLSSVYVAPQDIVRSYPAANIAITSIVYRDEIMEDLLRLGIESERILQPYIFMPDEVDWRAIEDDGRADWELMRKRFQMIAEWGWIPNNVKSVADYGAGHKFIKALLPEAANYYPIDFIDRGDHTIICDFNKQEFPNIHAELSVCAGVLMYVEPAKELVDHICGHTDRQIIFSFITLEKMPNIDTRRKLGFCQDFTEAQIIDMFAGQEYVLRDKRRDTSGNSMITLFLFEKRGNAGDAT